VLTKYGKVVQDQRKSWHDKKDKNDVAENKQQVET
jgi:hypothetical protein